MRYVFTRRLGTKGAAAIRTPDGAGMAEEGARIAWLVSGCRAAGVRPSRLGSSLLGTAPVADFAELVALVFPEAADRAELERRAAAHRAGNARLSEEAARSAAFIELVGATRFP